MRVVLIPLLILMPLLAGCQKDFDTEYAETEKRLKADAKRLDKQMAKEAAKEPSEAK
jgi:hypothetical protein